ncbi:MAG TPA: 16S rRNA (cytidine(1402)-2'-O)-methyltransferase [Dehalococcoidia bacterium]|nr:16S rRNA (cytidine(1402)-2'-O)-methyltransferase [Dehalococcoidia bacterium]
MSGTLYVVATPIGNLEDVTLRALRVLREVSLVASEDTRTTRRLLSHHGVKARIVSYTEHNMARRTPEILRTLDTGDVALVSEAGTPGVSDPGAELIAAVVAAGFSVSPVPGPAAVIAALTASGLSLRRFTFLGFAPRRGKERRDLFARFASAPETLVFFESPHRLHKSLTDLKAALGDRRLAACRELTKMYEEVFRGYVSQAIDHFTEPRGEFTIVVEGGSDKPAGVSDEGILNALQRLREAGASNRDAVAQVSRELGVPRRRAYNLALKD